MCGRFTLRREGPELARLFELDEVPQLRPRFNIAPAQDVAAVRRRPGGGRELAMLHWGLVPFWAKEASIGARMINARAESVAQKPAFRAAFKRRRCLIPADGFYEWEKLKDEHGKPRKQPWLFTRQDGRPFALAGLWESWNDPAGETLESCTILTTTANELLAPVHHRMPVILPEAAHAEWLEPGDEGAPRALALLQPLPSEQLEAWPVSRLVNNARNDTPDCVQPLGGAG